MALLYLRQEDRISHDSCEGRAVNSAKADQIILEATLSRILTPEFVPQLIKEMRSQFANTTELDRREQEVRFGFIQCRKINQQIIGCCRGDRFAHSQGAIKTKGKRES